MLFLCLLLESYPGNAALQAGGEKKYGQWFVDFPMCPYNAANDDNNE
jgi:hypothetical protein